MGRPGFFGGCGKVFNQNLKNNFLQKIPKNFGPQPFLIPKAIFKERKDWEGGF